MHEAGGVHRGQRAAQAGADDRRLFGAERSVLQDDVGQRAAANELHRQAELVADPLRPVDGDDVRMTDARQVGSLAEDDRELFRVRALKVEDLEGDFATEGRVPGAIDAAERAPPDLSEK